MKKNIFIIILSFLVVGLGGFITYDNFFKPSTKCNSNETKTTTTTKDSKKADSKTVETADERYKAYLSNLSKSIEKTYINETPNEDYSVSTINTSRIEKSELGVSYILSIDNKLELKISSQEVGLNDYKIADNVVSYYVIHTGNGGFSTLYYITTTGKVYSANVENAIYNKTSIETKEIDNVKNIVEIKEGSSTSGFPLFIDIDGNIIKK